MTAAIGRQGRLPLSPAVRPMRFWTVNCRERPKLVRQPPGDHNEFGTDGAHGARRENPLTLQL